MNKCSNCYQEHEENLPHPYRAQVVADSSGKFCGNGLTFVSVDAAKAYARDLMSRWMLVTDWRVIDENEQEVARR